MQAQSDIQAARAAALERLLRDNKLEQADRVSLGADASTRSYQRIVAGDRTFILMNAPPHAESGPCPALAGKEERRALGWNAISRLAASRVEAFVAIGQYLRDQGLSAPEILDVDIAHGWALLEDFGDRLFMQAIPAGADEIALYREAGKVLAHVQSADVPQSLHGRIGQSQTSYGWPLLDYDAFALEANADLFADWIGQLYPDLSLDDGFRNRWNALRGELVERAQGFARVFTIRDFHAENLLWLPEREGLRRVGILDFQDAVRGWGAWDFVMLLQDARRDVSPQAANAALRAYWDLTGRNEAEFSAEWAVLGTLNALRILGIFARLIMRDKKEKYRSFLAREWGHLNANLLHADLAPMRELLVRHIGRDLLHQAGQV